MDTIDSKTHDQKIRELAYSIWEKEGRLHGRDLEYWLKAERSLVKAQDTAVPAFIAASAPPRGEQAELGSMSLRLKPTTRQSTASRKAPSKPKKRAR